MIPALAAVGTALGAEAASAAAVGAAAISSAVALAGTAVSAIGSLQQGQQAKATAEYNARVENQRAQIAAQQGQTQASIDEANARRKMGEVAAAYGAAGVDMTGSPLAVMSDLATQSELTRRLDVYKSNLTATADKQQAGLDIAGGNAQQTASFTSAGSTLLTGVGKAFSPGNFYPGTPLTAGSAFGGASSDASNPRTYG